MWPELVFHLMAGNGILYIEFSVLLLMVEANGSLDLKMLTSKFCINLQQTNGKLELYKYRSSTMNLFNFKGIQLITRLQNSKWICLFCLNDFGHSVCMWSNDFKGSKNRKQKLGKRYQPLLPWHTWTFDSNMWHLFYTFAIGLKDFAFSNRVRIERFLFVEHHQYFGPIKRTKIIYWIILFSKMWKFAFQQLHTIIRCTSCSWLLIELMFRRRSVKFFFVFCM